MTGTAAATAPQAPGRLGQAADPIEIAGYLNQLGSWRDRRRTELDELDRAALAAPDAASLTPDVTLSMALWQAVAARYDELQRVWDAGRVGLVERQRLSALVWGRLDTGGTGSGGAGSGAAPLAVSVPEACRLSDALAAQLRQRLSLDPVGVDLAAHVRSLRATLERVRDRVPGEPAGPTRNAAGDRLDRLDRRLTDVVQAAQRGADVGGLVGPLESDAARCERDLIVAAANRRDDERDHARAHALRTELVALGTRVTSVADTCVAQVLHAPTLAVPRVESLGPVPDGAAAVDAYLQRLAAAARALALAEQTYAAPVAERDELRHLLELYRAKASSTGRDRDPEVARQHEQARTVLGRTPTDLERARAAVAAFSALLSTRPGGTR